MVNISDFLAVSVSTRLKLTTQLKLPVTFSLSYGWQSQQQLISREAAEVKRDPDQADDW